MKNIKTYEEFDWHALVTPGVGIGIACYGIGSLLTKYGINFFLDYKKKKHLIDISTKEDGLYTNAKWKVVEEDDIITLSKHSHVQGKYAISFTVDINKRTFEYKSEIYPLKAKLDKKTFNLLLEGISFCKEVSESIEDCFYDLTDEGYIVSLHRIDFSRKSFVVRLCENSGGFFDKSMEIKKVAPLLGETIKRIVGQYDVKIDSDFKLNSIYEGDDVINSFDNNIIRLNRGIIDLNVENPTGKGGDELQLSFKTLRTLAIPFIKK